MDYGRIYDVLIQRAKSRELISGYVERHHVIPRCLGGTDDIENLVALTAREHHFAHQLLVKIYPHVAGLWFAVFAMSSKNVFARHSSKSYEWIRRGTLARQSQRQKGKKRPAEHMQAMIEANRKPKSEEHKAKISRALKGKKVSCEKALRLKTMNIGRIRPKESGVKVGKAQAALTDAQVVEMRRLYDAGGVQDHISRKYGVSNSVGARAMKRITYQWVQA